MPDRTVHDQIYVISTAVSFSPEELHGFPLKTGFRISEISIYLVIRAGLSWLDSIMRLIWPYICCVYCRIILLSQISSISSQNRVHSRQNTFFWRFVGKSIKSRSGLHRCDHVFVICPALSYFFARFHWSRAKTGYRVTDIRPCTDVWDRVHSQGCLIWPYITKLPCHFPMTNYIDSPLKTGFSKYKRNIDLSGNPRWSIVAWLHDATYMAV